MNDRRVHLFIGRLLRSRGCGCGCGCRCGCGFGCSWHLVYCSDSLSAVGFAVRAGLGCSFDGGFDSPVHPAAADVAIHRAVDVLIRWRRVTLEKGRSRHELAGLAISALRDLMLDPCGLQRMKLTVAGCDPLDGLNFLAIGRRNGS